MSMSNASETNLLNLLFNNVDWPNVGDAAGLQNSATAGSFYVALHSSDPGDAGNQTTNEVSYTGYARVDVARSAGGFTVSGASDLRGLLSMAGEWTPFTDLSPQGLVNAIWAQTATTPLPVDVRKMNSASVIGTGQPSDLWRGA